MTSQMIFLLFYFFFYFVSFPVSDTILSEMHFSHPHLYMHLVPPPNCEPALHLSSLDTGPLVDYGKIKYNETDSRYLSVSSPSSPHLSTFFLIRSLQSICFIETQHHAHIYCVPCNFLGFFNVLLFSE